MVYLTGHALTRGIVEVEASFAPASGFICTQDGKLYFKNEWFETFDEAVLEFERQKAERIVKLEEQIRKFRAKKPVLRKEKPAKRKV